jgi:integrase
MPRQRKTRYGESREVGQITAKHVENALPAARGARYRIREKTTPGFALRVTDKGHTSFVVTRRIAGQAQPTTIAVRATGLAEAREQAKRYLNWMRAGKDPRAEIAREQEAAQAARQTEERTKGNTFAKRWELYDQHHIAEKRPLTQKEMRRPYRVYFQPELGDRPLHEIKRADISVMLMGIPKKVAANRAHSAIRGFLRWCLDRGFIEADPTPLKPPHKKAEKERDHTLTDAELVAIWNAAGKLGYPRGAWVRLLMVTGQRRAEVAGARWAEIDQDAKLWTIPADRTKANRAHKVPLSELALEIIGELPVHGSCLFSTEKDKPLQDYSGTKELIDELVKVKGWRFHDLRRTVLSWMEGRFSPVVMGAVANHSKAATAARAGADPVTGKSYSKNPLDDEKRRALDAWAQYLRNLTNPPEDKVVNLRGAPAA